MELLHRHKNSNTKRFRCEDCLILCISHSWRSIRCSFFCKEHEAAVNDLRGCDPLFSALQHLVWGKSRRCKFVYSFHLDRFSGSTILFVTGCFVRNTIFCWRALGAALSTSPIKPDSFFHTEQTLDSSNLLASFNFSPLLLFYALVEAHMFAATVVHFLAPIIVFVHVFNASLIDALSFRSPIRISWLLFERKVPSLYLTDSTN